MIAIYVRQSLDKKDSISIEVQIDFCKKEITTDAKFKIYQDKGFSGKNTQRPAFQELLQDIENNKITKLIVYRLDRISRSITDFANVIEFLEENKVDFISANEKFDTSTPMGRAMLYIIMVFAQLERETIAERIKDSYYSRGRKGIWLGGPAPLGFDIVKTTVANKTVSILKQNKDIELVKQIFEMYFSSSKSLGGISKYLKEVYGGMWNNIKLSRILHNPIYVKSNADIYLYYRNKKCILVNELEEFTGEYGCMLYGKRDKSKSKYNADSEQVLSIAKHKGIIEPNVFLYCQHKLSTNTQIKNKGKGKHSFLTGLVKCGYCGYSMSVKIYDSTKYLNCTGRYSTDLCLDTLETHYVEDIENFVLKEITKYTDKIKNQPISPNTNNTNNENNNAIKLKLVAIDEEIKDLIDKLPKANSILIEYINQKILELDTQKKELEEKVIINFSNSPSFELPDVIDWDIMNLESKRDLSHALINKILIKNDAIDIYWK